MFLANTHFRAIISYTIDSLIFPYVSHRLTLNLKSTSCLQNMIAIGKFYSNLKVLHYLKNTSGNNPNIISHHI